MCVIMIKPVGVKFPSYDAIKNCADSNPDGFSWTVSEQGRIRTFKTMDKSVFLREYVSLVMSTPESASMVLHARIATHGSKCEDNCHGFMNEGATMSFFHNGMLSVTPRGDMTDSETFFRDIFLPMYNMYGWGAADMAVKAVIGSSKFAFIDNTGQIIRYGHFTDVDGVFYSNSSYLPPTWYDDDFVSLYNYKHAYHDYRKRKALVSVF